MTLRIGISARLLHEPPPGLGLPLQRLQFLESSMAHWIMAHGAIALMVLMIPMAKARPMLVSVLVGGGTAVALSALPLRLGLFVGIVAGILAGFAAERWHAWRAGQ